MIRQVPHLKHYEDHVLGAGKLSNMNELVLALTPKSNHSQTVGKDLALLFSML